MGRQLTEISYRVNLFKYVRKPKRKTILHITSLVKLYYKRYLHYCDELDGTVYIHDSIVLVPAQCVQPRY